MNYSEYINAAQEINENNLALTIYEGFILPAGSFTAALDVQVDPVQYWRDRPLYLKTVKSPLGTIIEATETKDYIETIPEVDFYIKQMEKAGLAFEDYQNQLHEIMTNLDKYSEINEGEDLDIDYPDEEDRTLTLNIKDANGNIISSVTTNEVQREPNITPEGEKPVTILTELPEDYTDDEAAQEADKTSITSLPESYIKEKLWIANDYQKGFLNDAGEAASHFQENIDSIASEIDSSVDYYQSPEDLFDLNDSFKKDISIWYGIPLINLSPPDVPLKDAIILQIDTKHDWTLHLTNVIAFNLEDPELRITEVQIPPNKRFMAGVYTNLNTVTIYLKIEGDPQLYTKSIILANPINTKLQNFGSDAFGIKRICGTIYDYFLWNEPTPYIHEPGGILPEAPSTSHVYDGAGPRIRGKYIYPRKNWQEPAYNGGDWFDLNENFKFIYNGYLEGFFCKDNIKYTDFTIMWYQWQFGYPTGIRAMISDSVNNNFIRYDYDNFELLIDFNNVHYKEHITLPEYMWFQVALRFKLETNELTFSFIDFWGDLYEEVSLNIGPDLNFELISLWGRYNKENKYYDEIGRGIFGLVIIEDRYLSKEEIFDLYNDHKKFLSQFNPLYMDLPS